MKADSWYRPRAQSAKIQLGRFGGVEIQHIERMRADGERDVQTFGDPEYGGKNGQVVPVDDARCESLQVVEDILLIRFAQDDMGAPRSSCPRIEPACPMNPYSRSRLPGLATDATPE